MKALDRRGALKIFGSSILAAGAAGGAVSVAKAGENDDINAKIVIMGAGLAGISTAAKLRRELPNAKITVVDKDEKFYYQPGFTLVAIGFYGEEDVIYEKSKLIPEGVEWVRQNVAKIEPNANSLTLEDGSNLSYDYLIVASGVEYEFEAVSGISAADIDLEGGNISSIYTLKGALKTQKLMQNFAKNGGAAVFVDQRTPMKCSGANKKMTCMSEDKLRQAGNRDKGSVQLFCGGGKLFGDPTYAAEMTKMMIKRDIKFKLRHQILQIDQARGIAVFDSWSAYREGGENKIASEPVEVKFDWLHLPPKQRGSQILADAGLCKEGDKLNWLEVNRESLQSVKFKNIFGIGDICGFASGKTGASVRKMYPVLVQNLTDVIKGRALSAKFDGYTACPFITREGKAIMVEFNWNGTAPSMPCFGETRESYMNWLVKLYGFKPMVMSGMMKGLV